MMERRGSNKSTRLARVTGGAGRRTAGGNDATTAMHTHNAPTHTMARMTAESMLRTDDTVRGRCACTRCEVKSATGANCCRMRSLHLARPPRRIRICALIAGTVAAAAVVGRRSLRLAAAAVSHQRSKALR